MEIKWLTLEGKQLADYTVQRHDFELKCLNFKEEILSMKTHIKLNKNMFSKEEIIFLNDLLDSEDRDNLLIVFQIISDK